MAEPRRRKPFEERVLPDGRFFLRATVGYRSDGSQIRRSKTFPKGTSKKLRKNWVHEVKAAYLQQGHVPRDDITVDDLAKQWLERKKAMVQPNTYKSYDSIVRAHIAPVVGPMRVRNVGTKHVDDVLQTMLVKGLSARMMRLTRTTLQQILQLAQVRQVIASNPVQLVAAPSARKKRQLRALDHKGYIAFLKATEDVEHGLLLALLAGCGLRVGEALALRSADIDAKNRRLYVNGSLDSIYRYGEDGKRDIGPTKTKSGRRWVPVPELVIKRLTVERRGKRRDALLFPETEYTYKKVRAQLDKVSKAINIDPPLVPHELRHSAVNYWLGQGVYINVASKWLGHANAATTYQQYSQFIPDVGEEQARVVHRSLDKALAKPGRGTADVTVTLPMAPGHVGPQPLTVRNENSDSRQTMDGEPEESND